MSNKDFSVEVIKIPQLDLGELWYYDNEKIIQCDNVYGTEYFYPLYNWKNYYSYSPYKLLKLKGELDINKSIFKYLDSGRVETYLPSDIFIDKNIKRVGKPIKGKKIKIFNKTHFLKEFSKALIEDMKNLEKMHPNAVFGILTGGKDSLNILLLPWKNKIIALSGAPNFNLVKMFCKENNLNIDVFELHGEESDDIDWLNNEILINSMRIGLQDVRWTRNLFEFGKTDNIKEFIIITGSLGDTFLTPYYLSYRSKWNNSMSAKFYNKFRNKRKIFFQNLWERGSQWQGVYHGILRETSSLKNFSIYHGKNVTKILGEFDIEEVVKYDLRNELGNYISNNEVKYPTENPSPKIWEKRIEFLSLSRYLELLLKTLKK